MNTGKRIGELAELTGISVHALRQWHRRYDIGPTYVSKGGQRRYSEADIERIALIQTLRNQGFSLASLAEWPLATLRKKAESNRDTPVVSWDGPAYAAMAAQVPSVEIIDGARSASQAGGVDLWVVQAPALTDDVEASLPRPASGKVYVWYDFASPNVLARLTGQGYELRAGQPDARWLLNQIERLSPGFESHTVEELTQGRQGPPSTACACSNRLASTLRQLTELAQYNLECARERPVQAGVHRTLYKDIKSAQQAVFNALRTLRSQHANTSTVFESAAMEQIADSVD